MFKIFDLFKKLYSPFLKKEALSLAPCLSEGMTFDYYQQESFKTAMYPEKGTGSSMALAYVGLGLGESGEVQGKIKKVLRDFNGKLTPEMKEAIILEMSDVLWYLSSLSTELKIPLEEVAKKNLDKLFSRKDRGTITGSGDNR